MGSSWDEVSNIQFGKNYLKTRAALHITLSWGFKDTQGIYKGLMAIAVLTNSYLC